LREALTHGLEQPKVRESHLAIDDGSEAGILEWIEAQPEKCNPVTRTDLRHYCQTKYPVSISRGSVDSFILRRPEDVAEAKSASQEDTRLEVPDVFLNETIRGLSKYVQWMKAELVFDLNEAGISEWEDRRDKKMLIPKTISGHMMHHSASRNVKHISIITRISAAGESLAPDIVTSQDSQSLRRKLMSGGVRLSVDFVLRQRSKSYVNAAFSWSPSTASLSLTLTSYRTPNSSTHAKRFC
jgi:hypothetical protein